MFRTFLSTLTLLALVIPCRAQDELFDPITFQRIPSSEVFALDRGPVVGDLTGDGLPEIVVVATGAGSEGRDRILVYNATHTTEPLFTLIPGDLMDSTWLNMTPAIADVDGDGLKEVIATASRAVVFGWHSCPYADYTSMWHNRSCTHWTSYVLKWEFTDDWTQPEYHRSEPFLNWGAFGTPVVADIRENEGVMYADELVFVFPVTSGIYRHTNEDEYTRWGNSCIVLWWTGQSWANAHFDEQCPGINCFEDYLIEDQCAAVGDLDEDGLSEVVWLLPAANGEAVLLVGKFTDPPEVTRTVLAGKYPLNVYNIDNFIPSPVLCDYDLDGQLEAVFPVAQNPSGQGVEQMARVEFSGIEPIQITYRDLPTLPSPMSTQGPYSMAVADEPYEPNDLDIFVTAYADTTGDVNFLWFRPQALAWYQGPSFNWPKTVLEVSAWAGHGYTPAIAATLGGTDLQFLTQTVQSSETNRFHHFRLDNNFGPDVHWTVTGNRYPSQPILSASTITDLNGDGIGELVAMFGTSGTDAQIHAYEIGPYSRERIEWNGYQNNPQHTGLYAQPVTGVQPRAEMTWAGRIIVHGYYQVNAGQTLTIEPGTVVEFRPGAAMYIYGTFNAIGQGRDSIYFKADGAQPWNSINLLNVSSAHLVQCVIHDGDRVFISGGADVLLESCHIYDMSIGVEVYDAKLPYLVCQNNLIENCTMYGIRGTLSSGTFIENTVRGCDRAGIYWVGDRVSNAEGPFFRGNTITLNGDGGSPIAGGYFNSTTAWLECNYFTYNTVNQVLCENNADIVMNGDYQYSALNWLVSANTNLWCSCAPRCQCASPPPGFAPLMRISNSKPKLNYGGNVFKFTGDGTYLHDPCAVDSHAVKQNFFAPNIEPPGPNNPRFCPEWSFYCPIPLPASQAPECILSLLSGLEGSEASYSAAALAEADSDYATADLAYSQIVTGFPQSSEARWSTRGIMRAGLLGGDRPVARHDSLMGIWTDSSLPAGVRLAARREAIWALMGGNFFSQVRNELQEITVDTTSGDDSLWAAVMLELVTFLEDSRGSGLDSEARRQRKARRGLRPCTAGFMSCWVGPRTRRRGKPVRRNQFRLRWSPRIPIRSTPP